MSTHRQTQRLSAPIRQLASPAWLSVSPVAKRPAPAAPERESQRPTFAAHFHGACGGYL